MYASSRGTPATVTASASGGLWYTRRGPPVHVSEKASPGPRKESSPANAAESTGVVRGSCVIESTSAVGGGASCKRPDLKTSRASIPGDARCQVMLSVAASRRDAERHSSGPIA